MDPASLLARDQEKVKLEIAKERRCILELLRPSAPSPSWQPVLLQQPIVLFKVLAVARQGFVSVFDGHTRYALGKWTFGRGGGSNPPLLSCLFACSTPQQAQSAVFPASSKLLKSTKVLVEVEAQGPGYLNQSNGTWAVTQLRLNRMGTQFDASTATTGTITHPK